jgi:K+-sensing histidine kinase KdpD
MTGEVAGSGAEGGEAGSPAPAASAASADSTASAADRERELRARLVHDLRTPLTVVAGFADLLERRGDELSAPQRADLVRRIADGAREMRALLDADRSTRSGG